MSTDWHADAVVVGAGPAGSAAATALARSGLDVVLLDGRPKAGWRIGETLPPAARPLLRELGVLAEFESVGHLPSYGNLSSWGSADLTSTDFIFNPYGHGWQLDRERFETQLAAAARSAGARLSYQSRVVAVRDAGGGWELHVRTRQEQEIIRSRWLVDATGRASAIARKIGPRRSNVDALVCIYSVATPAASGPVEDQDTRTLVEGVPDGWWYTALTPGGRRTVAWLTDADLLQQHAWRQAGWFQTKLAETRHVKTLINRHGYALPDPPRCTSASSSRLVPCCGPGWLAVGDAALACDPLSSQGMLNALAGGLRAARAVAASLGGDRAAMGQYSDELEAAWTAYARSRREYYRMEVRWKYDVFWARRR